jgi:hypothetical protein
VAHHHEHHDGHFHQDDSDASVQHALGDAGLFSPALMPSGAPALEGCPCSGPAMATYFAAPPPFLQGLERPPKHTT